MTIFSFSPEGNFCFLIHRTTSFSKFSCPKSHDFHFMADKTELEIENNSPKIAALNPTSDDTYMYHYYKCSPQDI